SRSACSPTRSASATASPRRGTSTSPPGFRSSAPDVRLLAVVLVVLALAPGALAGTITDRAASALESNPVYLDPAATTVSESEAAALRREIEANGHGPIYIAVLPRAALAEGGGSAVGVVGELHRVMGRPGVYAVVAGNQFRAASTDLDRGE